MAELSLGNDAEAKRRAAMQIHATLKADSKTHGQALCDIGFSPLISEVDFGPIAYSPEAKGMLLSAVEQDSGALLAVMNRPQGKPIDGFEWSERNKFWFRYLKASPAAPRFSIKFKNDNHGGDVSIIPWYPEAPIWFG